MGSIVDVVSSTVAALEVGMSNYSVPVDLEDAVTGESANERRRECLRATGNTYSRRELLRDTSLQKRVYCNNSCLTSDT